MTTFSQLRKQINEAIGITDTFICYGKKVSITEKNEVSIDGEELGITFDSLDEAREYAKDYIKNTLEVDKIEETLIPEQYIASLISKHHNINRITDTLIDTYKELASSNSFSADPVIFEMKLSNVSVSHNKIEWKLDDGAVVAINASTQEHLNTLLKNKPEVVSHMRESKDNFINIVREVI